MNFLKVFFFFFLSALLGLVSCTEKYGHAHGGDSHIAISHKKGGKFEYHIKHEKHGSHHGSAHPHGYGGYGDGGH